MTTHDFIVFALLLGLGLAVASWAQVFYTWLLALSADRDARRIGQVVFLVYWLIAAVSGLLCMFAPIVVIRVLRTAAKPVTTVDEAAGFVVLATAVIVFYIRRKLFRPHPENIGPGQAGTP